MLACYYTVRELESILHQLAGQMADYSLYPVTREGGHYREELVGLRGMCLNSAALVYRHALRRPDGLILNHHSIVNTRATASSVN